jgi:CDP-diacylglycerol--serine O-phosphatidyltransferase
LASPLLIVFLWSLAGGAALGLVCRSGFALCCVLRLARFNAQIDLPDQPHKSAGFLTGVPAPVGAGLAFLPIYLWIASGNDLFRQPVLVGVWLALIAFLMISSLATLGWHAIRAARSVWN